MDQVLRFFPAGFFILDFARGAVFFGDRFALGLVFERGFEGLFRALRLGALALLRFLWAGFAFLIAIARAGLGAAGLSSPQPCASRTDTMAARMSFHVSCFIITALGNMQPSQQICRRAFVNLPSSP